MPNPLIRCGIVGTGAFAQMHAQAIKETGTMALVGAADTDKKRCGDFVSQHGGKAFESVHSMLKDGAPHLVILCTPDDTHAPLIREILGHSNAPRLLLVEKPLCTSRGQLDALESLPEKFRNRIVVDHTRRFNPGFQRIRDLIASGELGELRSANWRYYAGWMHIGVHVVDLLRMFFGELACSNAKNQGADRYPEDPLLAVELRSEQYPHASIRLEGMPEHPYRLFEGELFFGKGRIRIVWDDVFFDRTGDEYAGTPRLMFAEHFTANSSLESLKFLYTDCGKFLRDGNDSVIRAAGFAQACGTMEVLFAAKEAALA